MKEQAASIPEAQFETRTSCITCESDRLRQLSSGRYLQEPLRGFLANDPFGEDPLPSLRNASWTFVQCEDCGQKFHRDVLNDEWQDIQYNKWITSESIEQFFAAQGLTRFQHDHRVGMHAIERVLLLEKLTRDLRGGDPVRVLDFGCGEGAFLATCACFGFEGAGVEFSAAREATKRFDFFANLDHLRGSYAPGHFHAVTLFEVLEHLPKPLDMLRELNTHLTPGGILILETPNCDSVTDIKDREDYELISPLGHINAFTPTTQERIAKEGGFTRISPGVAQCTADMNRVYKREARRFLQPFLRRNTQQVFVKNG